MLCDSENRIKKKTHRISKYSNYIGLKKTKTIDLKNFIPCIASEDHDDQKTSLLLGVPDTRKKLCHKLN